MTPEELEAIEARLKWLAIYDSADDIPALTAALREAWTRIQVLEGALEDIADRETGFAAWELCGIARAALSPEEHKGPSDTKERADG